jgi:PPE-repeat protein
MNSSIITDLYTLLFVVLTFSLSSNIAYANDVEPRLNPSIDITIAPKDAKGGPRGVIQERSTSTIIVQQLNNDQLTITINDANDNQVYHTVTTELVTVISTAGWSAGNYVVITKDSYGDAQYDYITID